MLRPNPAGPLDPLEGPQLQTHLALEYAVLPHRGTCTPPTCRRSPTTCWCRSSGCAAVAGRARRSLRAGRALDVSGAEVSALIRDRDGALVLRVVNRTPTDTELVVDRDGTAVTGQVVDLTGAVLGEFSGRAVLRPWELLTLRLVEPRRG